MAKNGAMAKASAHALVVPMPFQGHINPLLELSKTLISAGFMVTFANTQFNHERILGFLHRRRDTPKQAGEGMRGDVFLTKKEMGILPQETDEIKNGEEENGPAKDGMDSELSSCDEKEMACFRLVSLEEGLPGESENLAYLMENSISAPMVASVERLVARLVQEDCPVSCSVSDFRLAYMKDIARKYAYPHLGFWTQSAAHFISSLMLAHGFQAPPDDSTLITSFPGVPPHKRSEVAVLSFGRQALSDEYLWTAFKRANEPDWVLINTIEELELITLDALQGIMGFRPLTVGPLVGVPAFTILKGMQDSIDDDGEKCIKWLDSCVPASVLYIAFGTVAKLSIMQLEELVYGLEATQQPFLWVFRPDLCSGLDSSVVDRLLLRLEKQGMVVPWAAQSRILQHSAVGGFLTHCGWNSILEGIAAGVPMLGWAQLGDQFVNQKCMESIWGNGLGMVKDKTNGGLVQRAEVEEKVMTLMKGDGGKPLKERALALKRAADGAAAPGGSSYKNLKLVLQGLLG